MMFLSAALLALGPLTTVLAHSGSHHNRFSSRSAHGKLSGSSNSTSSSSGNSTSSSSSGSSSSTETDVIDDADELSIGYTGNWTHGTVGNGTTLSWSSDAQASYNFTTPKGATGVSISSTLKSDRGAFKVLRDGKVVGNGTTHGGLKTSKNGLISNVTGSLGGGDGEETASEVVFESKITGNASHAWTVVKTSAEGVYLSLDEISISGVSAPSVNTTTSSFGEYFYGGNNFFLHGMDDAPRRDLLDQMAKAGMQYVRIFLTHTGAGSKGSASIDIPDVEPNQVGVYDDTILEAMDQLMVDASQRGIKLLISLHDRYALGFWGTDQYAVKYGIVSPGSQGAQQKGDAAAFYTSSTAAEQMDARYTHIMNHKNKLMGNKRWADLSEAIFAVEPQNEPMGHMDVVAPDWVCQRATTLKKLVGNSGIIVGTGGGIDIQSSQQSWNTDCPAYDAIMVHDYGTDAQSSVAALAAMKAKYEPQGKMVIFEEWGATGGGKAQQIQSFVDGLKAAKVPWSYWEITNPGQGSNDFEIWTNEEGWQYLSAGGDAGKVGTSSGSSSGSSSSSSGSKTSGSSSSSKNNNDKRGQSVKFGVSDSRRIVKRSQGSRRMLTERVA